MRSKAQPEGWLEGFQVQLEGSEGQQQGSNGRPDENMLEGSEG